MSSSGWNLFRILADVSHVSSKCILIWAIFTNKSAEGISLITQVLYLAVFCARYLPRQYWSTFSMEGTFHKIWNISLMSFYIVSSAYIVWLMMRVFARTREREKAWKMGVFSSLAAVGLAPFVMMIFDHKSAWSFAEFSWTASEMLESVCVLPQLLLLRQTTVPTVIDSYYLVTLGSYRAFYIVNWVIRLFRERDERAASARGDFWISFIFGIVQTAMYIDFAWVYFTRQRVKLRGGAIVDSDDLNQGWLVKRLIGDRRTGVADEEESAPQPGQTNGRTSHGWGPRGISVSADEDLPHESQAAANNHQLADPAHFEDDLSDDEELPVTARAEGIQAGISSDSEWRNEPVR